MRKDSVENKVLRGEYPSKEVFEQYYIVENHSQNDTAKHFNITRPVVQSLVSLWNLVKTKESISQLSAERVLNSNSSLQYKISTGQYPDKEKFITYYVDELHSKQQTATHFGITTSTVNDLIAFWNVHKTKEEVRKTKEQTCVEKFGCISNLQSDNTKALIKETCLKKYGVEHVSQADCVKAKVRDTFRQKYGVSYALQNSEIKEKVKTTVQSKYGVNWPCQLDVCRNTKHGSSSQPNKDFELKLQVAGIDYQKEYPIENYSYDFKIDDVLIEIDPWISHQSTTDSRYPKKEKKYHENKTSVAMENNFHCIHVFDWDNQNKIIDIFLKAKNKCYARQCEIKLVDVNEEIEFLNKYHLQGYIKSDLCIGLYYNNTIVQLMSFSKPRYNKNYEYELLRLCSSYQVVGGSEKIFKYFLKNYKVKNIISYCDLSKFNGNVYNNLGFTLLRKSISKHWYSPKLKRHITDNLLRQRGFDQLLGNVYGYFGKGSSNDELMLKAGFVEIYDAGQATYIYQNT